MKARIALVLLSLPLAALPAAAQKPVFDDTLTVNTNDCSSVVVAMRMRNLPDQFHLATVRHFLIDDRPWRYVDDLRLSSGTIAREQDGLWRVTGAGPDATLRYRVVFKRPEDSDEARKPFLTPSGGLIGDLHAFLFAVEAPEAPARVALEVPTDWTIATTLSPTAESHTFFASNASELSDSPILAGKLRHWRFQVDQAPVHVAYWAPPGEETFDETTLLSDLEKIVQTAAKLFGGVPWDEYLFQIRDGPRVNGFEHRDCVTLELPNAALARHERYFDGVIAHEFFHAWNMIRIHSAEYTGPDYREVKLSGLWFSEGFTMYYADLILRRAGLPVEEATRQAHLESLMADYLQDPGVSLYSAEQASRAAFGRQTGGASPNVHLQGELIAAMLDLTIRDATEGRKSLDDLMRAMYAHFGSGCGFTTGDVEEQASELCGHSLESFFDANVRQAKAIDFDQYLRLVGLKVDAQLKKATNPDGTPMPDLRVGTRMSNTGDALLLYPLDPSAWRTAGVRSGDGLVKLNGLRMHNESDFWSALKAAHIGDHLRLKVLRHGTFQDLTVPVKSYDALEVTLRQLPESAPNQKAIFAAWAEGR
jgi:predicted metalloprotease with PDZ domain